VGIIKITIFLRVWSDVQDSQTMHEYLPFRNHPLGDSELGIQNH